MRANIFICFLLLLLSGCGGGSSGANGPDPFNPGTDPVIALSLQLLDANCNAVSENSFSADDSICVQATLTSDGAASSGEVVSFSIDSSIGTLSSSSSLTNASGIAQVTLTSTEGSTGAATVTASFGTNTSSRSFQFTPGAPDPVTDLSIALLDANCEPIQQAEFTTDDSICVRATLTSDGSPVAGEVVGFSLSTAIGTLSSPTALTNSNGVAQVTINNTDTATGASSVIATFNTISSSANYEYIESIIVPPTPEIAIAVLDASCQPVDEPVFTTAQTICVQATLTLDGAPMVEELVSFALGDSIGSLDPATALTDGSGIAQVVILPNATIGATSVTATFETASASANYEFIRAVIVDPPVPVVDIAILDANCQPVAEAIFTNDQTICVRATVTLDGAPISGELVGFSLGAQIGTLNNSSALTSSDGIAEVTITPNGTTGATSVTATYSDVSNSANYEYTQAQTPGKPSITIELIAGGISTNRFEAGENVAIRALLLGADGVPVNGEIINFSVADSNVSISPSSALTDNGTASAVLVATESAVGAHTLTATTTLDGQTVTQSLNFQVLPTSDTSTASISIDMQVNGNGSNRFSADENAQIVATLLDENNDPVADTIVSFTINTGNFTLSPDRALTDDTGSVTSTLTATESDVGAHVLTAIAEVAGQTVSQTFNFEVLEAGDSGTASLDLELIVNGNSNNRFEVGENVAIRALFRDAEGATVPDTIVSFSVPSADITITPADALTNNGIASAVLVASDAAIGAHTLTATGELNGEVISATLSFEVQEATGTGDTPMLSLAILNAQCQPEDQSFATNETICLQATLTQNEQASANEIVSFALSSNLGSLSALSALTNSQGIAEVQITNSTASVGAASVTATFDTVNDTQNYEYVAVEETPASIPTISVSIRENDSQVTVFRAGREVQAVATVFDPDGEPVEGVIVTYGIQGSGPVVSPATALTNAQGSAQVQIITTENDLGAYALQVSTTANDTAISNSVNFEVQSAGTVIDSITRFGHINASGDFIEGVIGSSVADENSEVIISAGATTGFDVALVNENDERITTPTPITFSTTCVTNNQATIDETVTTINGIASATFEDLSCAGATGNTDQVIASVVINNVTTSITRELSIRPEDIGSISFVSATPDSIVLQGTGGQNNASVSTLVFQVNGALGNPLAQQEVTFDLNTTAGGLTLAPACVDDETPGRACGLTNSSGQVSARVTAGTVPTPVRVTASVDTSEGETIVTQSDLLTVNTGLPDQNSMSISSSVLNPEAFNIDGQTATITARLADAFNNPVPNGTTVNFTTESGSIESSCLTGEEADGTIDPNTAPTGTCSVTWTSQSPRSDDHRNTIMVYAIGHETLFDANGNNAYEEDVDGGPILDNSDSGFTVSQYGQTGFVDMSEAWLDINENFVRDDFEPFIPFNDDGIFNAADGLFNGPQCNSVDGCGEQRSIHIRRALVMITSSSQALWRVYVGDVTDIGNVVATNDSNVTITNANVVNGEYVIADGDTAAFTLVYYDTAEQLLAAGTQLGTLDGDGNISTVIDTVGNTNQTDIDGIPGDVRLVATVTNETNNGDIDDTGTVTFGYAIDSPSGARTEVTFVVNRAAP